jgi:homocitrate synthase NifV
MNSIHESYTLAKYRGISFIRVRGLDDILLENFESAFGLLLKIFGGEVELCPSNRFGCASAIATEWGVSGSGKRVVTSLCGIGGFAAFEEVVMALRDARLRKVGKSYPMFPAIGRLMEEITGIKIPQNKPILGDRIFAVASGIHVDGIIKQPKCYAPFPPEDIGQKHTIVLGKQSGKASIFYKLQELGIKMTKDEVWRLLLSVKKFSIQKNRALTEDEFETLTREVLAQRGCTT